MHRTNETQQQNKDQRLALVDQFVNDPKYARYRATHIDFKHVDNVRTIIGACLDLSLCPRLDLPKFVDTIAYLDLNGYLIRKPAPVIQVVEVEKIVEVAKPLTKIERQTAVGINPKVTTELDRYERDHPKRPTLSEEQKTELNRRNAESDAQLNEITYKIGMFTGRSHARTAEGRKALKVLLTESVNQGLPVEQIAKAIDRKIDELSSDRRGFAPSIQ